VGAAISACAAAVSAFPQEPRFRYQLARALQIRDKNAAFQIFQQLVAASYPAAHDNAGWLFITERKDYEKAIALFKAGDALGDADCAVSLFTMIAEDRLSVPNADRAKIELLEKAAAANHPGALVALPIERAKQGIVSNQPLPQSTDTNLNNEGQGKSGSFPVASCKGWSATRTTIEGRDSDRAIMRGVVTDADLREYCERDPGGETIKYNGKMTIAQCITSYAKKVAGLKIVTVANCNTGEISFQYGNDVPLRARFPLGANTDTSCASGMPPVISQFQQLCPVAAKGLDVNGRRAPAPVQQLSDNQAPSERASQDRYGKLTVEALCSENAVADPDWRDEVRRRNIAFEKCNPRDRGLSTMTASPKPPTASRFVGPSFDCLSKAAQSDPLPRIICGTPELAVVELSYVVAFYALRHGMSDIEQRKLAVDASAFTREVITECGLSNRQTASRPEGQSEVACIRSQFEKQRAKLVGRLSGAALEEAQLTPAEAVRVQELLRSHGYLSTASGADGVFGNATRKAIAEWQQANGARTTGFASREMLSSLEIKLNAQAQNKVETSTEKSEHQDRVAALRTQRASAQWQIEEQRSGKVENSANQIRSLESTVAQLDSQIGDDISKLSIRLKAEPTFDAYNEALGFALRSTASIRDVKWSELNYLFLGTGCYSATNGDPVKFEVSTVVFGEIIGAQEEAIVGVRCGWNGRVDILYVFTFVDGKPRLRFRAELGSSGLGGLSSVSIENRRIVVERYIGSSRASPDSIERSEWRWSGDGFKLAAAPTYRAYVLPNDVKAPNSSAVVIPTPSAPDAGPDSPSASPTQVSGGVSALAKLYLGYYGILKCGDSETARYRESLGLSDDMFLVATAFLSLQLSEGFTGDEPVVLALKRFEQSRQTSDVCKLPSLQTEVSRLILITNEYKKKGLFENSTGAAEMRRMIAQTMEALEKYPAFAKDGAINAPRPARAQTAVVDGIELVCKGRQGTSQRSTIYVDCSDRAQVTAALKGAFLRIRQQGLTERIQDLCFEPYQRLDNLNPQVPIEGVSVGLLAKCNAGLQFAK
jgi:hypothetical protein